eukprot:1193250-Prorocentrum_minimum.AAC.2
MSGVRVFGCRAFVHTPPGDRDGKLGARSVPGLYVGHDNRSPPTSCIFPTPPTARTPFVLSDDLSLSRTLTSTPPAWSTMRTTPSCRSTPPASIVLGLLLPLTR